MERKASIPVRSGEQLKRSRRDHALVRAAVQLAFFIAMPSAFYAGFAGLKSIIESIRAGSAIETDGFLWALILTCAFTIVFGRFFCGYICAFGSFGDLIHLLSGLIQTKLFKRKKQFELPEKASKPLRILKYLNLAFIVVFAGFGLYAKLRGASVWDVFSQITALSFSLGGMSAGIVLFAVVIALMAVKAETPCGSRRRRTSSASSARNRGTSPRTRSPSRVSRRSTPSCPPHRRPCQKRFPRRCWRR